MDPCKQGLPRRWRSGWVVAASLFATALTTHARAQPAPAPTPPPEEPAEAPEEPAAPAPLTPGEPSAPAAPAPPPAPAPLAPSPASDAAQDDAAAAEARLQALEERVEALEGALYATPAAEHEALRIYGFADVGARSIWLLDGCADTSACIQDGRKPSRLRNLIEEYPTFLLGNLNLYFDATPIESFRLLTEVRLSRYPQGVETGTDFARQDNDVRDVTSSTGRNQVTWSGIILERAQLEWSRYDALRVLAGYFLTPYGIWNVDHGAPTLISLALPEFFAQEYIPTHQTGVQVLGTVTLGGPDLGYHAYVANGRSPSVIDNDNGKGVGGRVFVEWHDPLRVVLGASGYYESYKDRAKEIVDLPSFTVDSDKVVEYDEWALAADAALDAGHTRVRAEWVLHRIDYADGFRASLAPTLYAPDRWRQNFYVIVAHQIGATPVEPYLYAEYARRAQANDRAASISSLGVNYTINPYAKLKLQSTYTRFYAYDEPDAPSVRQDDFVTLDTRFVMAF